MAQIGQAYVSSKLTFFKPHFLSRHHLVSYHNPHEPSLFYGCYDEQDHQAIQEHQSLAVVIWGGADATNHANFEALRQLSRQSHNPLCFVAISTFIEADMQAHGLPYLLRHLSAMDVSRFNPTPLGDKVYVYNGSFQQRDRYGYIYLPEIKERLPQVSFIEHYVSTAPHAQMPSVYEQCALGIRLMDHDGLPHTMIELGMMGRKCVWNGNFPSAIAWDSVDSVVETIGRELARAGQTDTELARQVQQAISQTDWLDTDCYEESLRYYGSPPATRS